MTEPVRTPPGPQGRHSRWQQTARQRDPAQPSRSAAPEPARAAGVASSSTTRESAAGPPATTACSAMRATVAATDGQSARWHRSAKQPGPKSTPAGSAGYRAGQSAMPSQDSLRRVCNCATSASSSASSVSLTSACSDIQATNGETEPLSVFSTKLPTALRIASFGPVAVL